MLLRGRLDGTPHAFTLRPSSLTVGVDEATAVAWDRGGRLYTLFRHPHMNRRGLNGRVLRRWHGGGRRYHRWLDGAEADMVAGDAAALAAGIRAALDTPSWLWEGEVPEEGVADLRALLDRAAVFDAAAARADAAAFERVMGAVGILPPDRYLSLFLKATEGCSFNTCTFCRFYREDYRVRTVAEFEDHARQVLDYLGDSLSLRRRSLFLGSANALAVPMPRIVPLLEAARRLVGDIPVAAFVDGFTGLVKTAGDYRRLASLGLQKVYVGLESGHDPLLEEVGKPATAIGALETVRALKAGGVDVGVIVLVGLGGAAFAARHEADTARILSEMDLGGQDSIFFSTLLDDPARQGRPVAGLPGVPPLDGPDLAAQQKRIAAAVAVRGAPPRMIAYDADLFIY